MQRKQGVWIVGILAVVAAALAITAFSLAPVEHIVWLQTAAPVSNADIVCVERPAVVHEGDTLVVVAADGMIITSIARTVRTHCTPYEDMICATSSGIMSCR